MNRSRSAFDPTVRVALIHDWLVAWRGGERVLAALAALFPGAPIYTLIADPAIVATYLPDHPIRTAPIHRWPFSRHYFRWLLPLFPAWVEQWDLNGFDLIVSSHHCVAKGVIPAPDALHVCYTYTPMRYIWDRRFDYWGGGRFYRWLERWVLHRLRIWDVTTARRVDLFIADSHFVARRIERYYRRPAAVVYPPIRTDFFQPADVQTEHFLVVSALVPYKRVDVIIEAFRRLPNERLIVVGDGPMRRRLQRMAPRNVMWRRHVTDAELRDLYQRAHAVILPAVEDFGLVVAEAMACGRPAIVYCRGGAAELVRPGETGWTIDDVTPDAICAAVDTVHRLQLNSRDIRRSVEHLNVPRFQQQIRTLLQQAWTLFRSGAMLDEKLRVLDIVSENAR